MRVWANSAGLFRGLFRGLFSLVHRGCSPCVCTIALSNLNEREWSSYHNRLLLSMAWVSLFHSGNRKKVKPPLKYLFLLNRWMILCLYSLVRWFVRAYTGVDDEPKRLYGLRSCTGAIYGVSLHGWNDRRNRWRWSSRRSVLGLSISEIEHFSVDQKYRAVSWWKHSHTHIFLRRLADLLYLTA